ncbi:MAG: sulfatase-like hydrolase/transferase [Rikenellaceae bacterium]
MKTTILTTALLASAIATHAREQPNIILLMADDMGWGDVGFNGGENIQTPSLDRLASQGVILERFYSNSAVSSPTRSSVITGRNPYRTGIFTANKGIVRQEEQTIPELLKQRGYLTGHFGKWHLGTLTDQERDANRGKVGNSGELNPPRLHGYDDSFTTESKVPTYDPMLLPTERKGAFWDYIKPGEQTKAYGTAYWRHDGTKESENLAGDDSRVIMDRVIPFIDRAKGESRPFMSVVWFHAPHLPCVAGPKHQEMYKDQPLDKRNYYGCVTALDEQVGRLVEHLRKIGELDNTLILFCSDNGPEGKESAPGTTGGLTGRKRSLHEGGIRVPAFAVWGDKIAKGGKISTPCHTCDYLPTIADAAGIKLVDRELDGESMLPFIVGKRKVSERERPMIFLLSNQAAVIDNQYKLYFKGDKYSLYDITNDRTEQDDLAANNPQLVKEYQSLLDTKIAEFKASFSGEEYTLTPKITQKWEDPRTKDRK